VQVQKGSQTPAVWQWVYSGTYDGSYQETRTDNNGTLRFERLQYPSGGSTQSVLRS
jgi:hypothetical protein